jgi:hypothetical protein
VRSDEMWPTDVATDPVELLLAYLNAQSVAPPPTVVDALAQLADLAKATGLSTHGSALVLDHVVRRRNVEAPRADVIGAEQRALLSELAGRLMSVGIGTSPADLVPVWSAAIARAGRPGDEALTAAECDALAGAAVRIVGASAGGDALAAAATAALGQSQAALMQATQGMQEMQMSFNLQYLQLQNSMQNANRQFTMVSNIMKTKHDTVKNSISNIR